MRARNLWIGLVLLMGVGLMTAPQATALDRGDFGAVGGLLTAVQQDRPTLDLPDVDIDVHKTERVVWYFNPIVMGAGLVFLVLLIALAVRGGGGTTVVKS